MSQTTVHVRLNEGEMTKLQNAHTALSGSRSDVLAKALNLLNFVLDEQNQGRCLYVADLDGGNLTRLHVM